MMNYLKNYGLSDGQIASIEKTINDRGQNIDTFKYDSEKIISIIDLFVSIGVTNIYGLITTNPSMFRDTPRSIENRINKYENKSELARLLNEDASNLKLVGIF